MNTPAYLIPSILIIILIVVAFMLIYPPQMEMISLEDDRDDAAGTDTRIVTIQPVSTYSSYSWPWSSMGWNNWFGYQSHNNTRWPYYSRPIAYNNL